MTSSRRRSRLDNPINPVKRFSTCINLNKRPNCFDGTRCFTWVSEWTLLHLDVVHWSLQLKREKNWIPKFRIKVSRLVKTFLHETTSLKRLWISPDLESELQKGNTNELLLGKQLLLNDFIEWFYWMILLNNLLLNGHSWATARLEVLSFENFLLKTLFMNS